MSHPPRSAPGGADPCEAVAWRRRLGLAALVALRWALAAGLGVVLVGVLAAGVHGRPLGLLLVAVGALLLSNAALTLTLRRTRSMGVLPVVLALACDIVGIHFLTMAGGAALRPFASCAVVYLALGATLLDGFALFALEMLQLACVAMLACGAPVGTPRGELWALALAIALSGRLVCTFVPRLTHAGRFVEAQLAQQKERLARSEQLKSLATLAAGAAHELSPPLSTISGAARDMERRIERAHEPLALKEDLLAVRREIERARGILQQLVDDAGASIVEPAHPIAAVELVAAALAGLAGGSRVRVLVAPGAEEAMVQVPKRSLARSVRALVNNALEASRQRELRQRPGQAAAAPHSLPVEVYVERTAAQCHVVVRDQGAGMDAQVLARVSEPFFSTKGPGRGMGLGLFLARTVLERLGGGLEVHSQPGSGTTVTLQMPVVELSVLPRRGRHGIAPCGQEDGFPYGPEHGAAAHVSLG